MIRPCQTLLDSQARTIVPRRDYYSPKVGTSQSHVGTATLPLMGIISTGRQTLTASDTCHLSTNKCQVFIHKCQVSENKWHLSQDLTLVFAKVPVQEPTEKVQYVNLINDCTLGRDIGEC